MGCQSLRPDWQNYIWKQVLGSFGLRDALAWEQVCHVLMFFPPSIRPPTSAPPVCMTNGDKILPSSLLPLPLFNHRTRSLLRCHRISLDDSLRILHTCCHQLVLGEKDGRDVISVLPDGQWGYADMGRDEGSVCESMQPKPST